MGTTIRAVVPAAIRAPRPSENRLLGLPKTRPRTLRPYHYLRVAEQDRDNPHLVREVVRCGKPSCGCAMPTAATSPDTNQDLQTPRYDLDRGFVGVDSTFSMMEIAEEFLGVPRSCQVGAVPFQELEKFIAISKAIETEPSCFSLWFLTC
jgi:hypothetical protein